MTDIEAAKLVAMLFATFPSGKIEPRKQADGTPTPGGGTAGMYARLLRDLDYDLAVAAIAKVAATFRFGNMLPTVAEIREAAASLAVGDVQPGAVAFGAVLGLLKSTKEHRGYHTSDPPPREVVERFAGALGWQALQAIGGWRAICTAEENDPAPRSQFVRVYDALAVNERRNVVSNTLPAVASYLALRGDDARQAALPDGATDLEKRGADAWGLPTSAGAHIAGIVKAMTGGAA